MNAMTLYLLSNVFSAIVFSNKCNSGRYVIQRKYHGMFDCLQMKQFQCDLGVITISDQVDRKPLL